jgi:hypothetical protein
MAAPKPPTPTEAEVIELLRAKLTKPGNGGSGEYAFLHHVRNGAGFDANRTFDVIAVSLWPSRGLTIDAYEIKVSRSDWQRELAHPDKAEAACRVADRFTMVMPAGMALPGELPPTWGLIEVTGGKPDGGVMTGRKLRTVVAAPMLRDGNTAERPISRSLLVGLLRAADGVVLGKKSDVDGDRDAIRRAAAREAAEDAAAAMQDRIDRLQEERDKARDVLARFERVLGRGLTSAYLDREQLLKRAEDAATAIRAVLAGDQRIDAARHRAREIARELRDHADAIEQSARAL